MKCMNIGVAYKVYEGYKLWVAYEVYEYCK